MTLKRYFSLALIVFLTSCSGMRSKVGDVGSDPNVSSQNLSFTVEGSDAGGALKTVNFEFDKFGLTDRSRELLRQNAQWIKENGGWVVEIEGHCDDRGSVEYNIALGEKRANTVKEFLINVGVPQDRISVISYGKERLLDKGQTESAHYKNRRANFRPIRR